MDFNIVTFHRSINYGAVLQAYALQEAITEMGYEAGVFDYKRKKGAISNPTLRARISGLIGRFIKDEKADKEREDRFAEFRDSLLKLNLSLESKAFLAGSDQVWNFNPNLDSMYFLQFVQEDAYKASYAASMISTNIPESKRKVFEKYISTFDAISVREEGIKGCLSSFYNGDIHVNIDPTLLHDHAFYEQIMRPIPEMPENYILAYVLHIPKNGNNLIQWLRKETGSQVVLLDSTGKVGLIIKNDIVISNAGPREFLWLFKNAQSVVTTSFHGTCFSLIFEKEFYSIVNPASPGRISNLLEKCGLKPVTEADTTFSRNTNIDWHQVRRALASEKQKSVRYLENIHKESLEKKKKRLTGTVEKMQKSCTGCAACVANCSVDAISMVLNDKGFYEPAVDTTKCIQCGKCINRCPLNSKEITIPEAAYYGWHKDQNVLFQSSSGGAFNALASTVINKSGVVFGAAYSEDWRDVVFMSTNEVPLEKLQKSKYTVSNPEGVHNAIEKELKKGIPVLFCGTPCQCAGIKGVYGSKYKNLITCDFVCGGMASLAFYREHIDTLERQFNAKIDSIDFRPKDWGWGRYHILVTFSNGKKYAKRDFADSYFKSFLTKASVRESCENCQYYHYHRSDITIADFWGYRALGIEKNKLGMSMIVCNTKTGYNLFNSVENFYKKSMAVDATMYTICDKSPDYNKLKAKEEFFRLAQIGGFEAAANQMYDTNELHYYFKRAKQMLHIK